MAQAKLFWPPKWRMSSSVSVTDQSSLELKSEIKEADFAEKDLWYS